MADERWKRVEREKCRELGGERSGPTGRDTPDCTGIEVGLEVKSYKTFVFLTKDWNQAVENAAKVGKIPVLAVRQTGRKGRDVVQMYVDDWRTMEIHAASAMFVTDGIPELLGARNLVRMPWDYFVALYRAAYTPTEGDSTV